MTWQQIRDRYPDQWVIMEALEAHTEGTRRVFDSLGILDTCSDNDALFPRYRALRSQYPHKEIIFFHGSREVLDIAVEYWHGIRYQPPPRLVQPPPGSL